MSEQTPEHHSVENTADSMAQLYPDYMEMIRAFVGEGIIEFDEPTDAQKQWSGRAALGDQALAEAMAGLARVTESAYKQRFLEGMPMLIDFDSPFGGQHHGFESVERFHFLRLFAEEHRNVADTVPRSDLTNVPIVLYRQPVQFEDIEKVINDEPLTDDTKHELYDLIGNLARQGAKTENGSTIRLSPNDRLIVHVWQYDKLTKDYSVLDEVLDETEPTMVAQVYVLDDEDGVHSNFHKWKISATDDGLTLNHDLSRHLPQTVDEVREALRLELTNADQLSPEEQVMKSFYEADTAESINESARWVAEGLDNPTENQVRELINLLRSLADANK